MTTDKAVNKILWKTIFVELMILPHFISNRHTAWII